MSDLRRPLLGLQESSRANNQQPTNLSGHVFMQTQQCQEDLTDRFKLRVFALDSKQNSPERENSPEKKLSPLSGVIRQVPWQKSRDLCSSFSRYDLTHDEVRRIRKTQGRFMFQPSSRFLVYWDILTFFCTILTAIREPAIWAFALPEDDIIGDLDGLAVSCIFMFDTFLHFFRAKKKYTREGVVIVTHVPTLAKKYLRRMFLVDFISGIPFAFLFGHEHRKLAMIRMLRFYHTPRLIANVQSITTWSYSMLNLSEFGIMSALILHWIACAWGSLALRNETSWLTQVLNKCEQSERMSTWSWHQRPCLENKEFHSFWQLYMLSFYWSVTVLSSVGFGDVTPTTHTEFVCAICCMAIGGCVWAYVVGSVCGMVFSMDKHRSAYEMIMNDVNAICRERKLPRELQSRVREFYRHAQEFMRMQEYHKTLAQLSPALKGEVVVWMYGSLFKRVWYFDIVDETTAHLLFEGMVPKMYAIGEWIEAAVDQCRALVFLRSGLCVRKCNLLAPGAVWGLDVILGSEEHEDIEELLDTAYARSVNFAFVLKLSKHSIDHVANLVPVFATRLRKAHLRMLLWRGMIAASRAASRLRKPVETLTGWDMLGKRMGQVVHRDRQILDGHQFPVFHRRSSCSLSGSCNVSRHQTASSIECTQADSNTDPAEDSRSSREDDVGDGLGLSFVAPAPKLPHLRKGEDAERFEEHDFTDALCDASWKAGIEESLEKQEEKITMVQEELADQVATVQDGVEELTRLMHQLLGRLDAEEKY